MPWGYVLEMSEPAPNEPTSEADRFRAAMKHILTVPKAEILRREAEYRKQRKARHGESAS